MSNEHKHHDQTDRESAPAPEMNAESLTATTMLVEPFAEFGKSLEAQLLELEACCILAGKAPRRMTNLGGRGRNLR
ncbi:MAG: hypothetical protein KF708_00880 [Pirellulales bacterium]|nr:hypothetical protein [Pirellulales bacterium]